MFYDRFEELCAKNGVKPGRACVEMGVSRSLAAKWKATGTERPSAEALEKMSLYFGLSIDEILGTQKEKPLVNDDEELTEYLEQLRTRPEMKTGSSPPHPHQRGNQAFMRVSSFS